MSDQQYIDYLYNQLLTQYTRYNQFKSVTAPMGAWNRSVGEKDVLDKMMNLYKKYYKAQSEQIKTKLSELKEYNISSYFTYNTEYHINEYNARVEEVNKYVVDLESKNIENVIKDDLSNISEAINGLYPNFILTPTLLGRLS